MRLKLPLLFAAVLLATNAHAASDADWSDCKSSKAQTAIDGCTRVLGDTALNAYDRATAHNYRGRGYRRSGDYDRAIAEYNEAIRLRPDYHTAFNNRGLAYRYKRNYDQAIADYSEALRLKPDYSTAYHNRGRAYRYKGDYDQAIADYSEAIRLKPDYSTAFNNRGIAYRLKGDYDQAIADYSEAIRIKLDYATAYNNRGVAYRYKGEYDLAIADYDKALELDPDYASAFSNRGLAYRRKGEYDRAIADYNEALRLDPDYATAFNNRGLAYRYKGEYDLAIADYDKALELDPDHATAYRNRGNVYVDKGDYDQAIADFGQAIRADPEYTAAYTSRALAYQQKGDTERAIAEFRAALAVPQKYENGEWAHRTAREQLAVLEQGPDQPDPVVLPDRRVALVIGNSNYHSVSKLPNPKRDAQTVADAFRRLGFAEVELLNDLSKQAMERALIDFTGRAQSADWAVIYFAGHGMEMDGENYLVPVDAQLKQDRHVRLETVSLDDVLEAAGGADTLRLVILDACRDNPFAAQMQRTVTTRSIGRGLARIEPTGGTLVAYAARDGQVALDGEGDNSPFVSAFVQHLGEPGLDIRLMFAKVRDTVMAATNNQQQPFTYGSLPGTELTFRPVE